MNDDWRLEIDFEGEENASLLAERLGASELEHELSDAFVDRVIVSRDGPVVFLYAGTEAQATRARDLVLRLARDAGWEVQPELRHWHPDAEDWEDPAKPLPAADAAAPAENERRDEREDREAERDGHPEFEVRVDLDSRHEAAAFAERLRAEGLPAVHRWRFLLVGAADEDAAKALADRLRAEAPDGSKVAVEGTWAAAWAERPPNPFAFLGGLGG